MSGLNRVRYRYRLLLHILALEYAGAGLSGGFQSDTVETRCSIANAPTSMTIRVTHIYRAASTANGISSIVTPISHPPISAPEIRAPADQAALDVCS